MSRPVLRVAAIALAGTALVATSAVSAFADVSTGQSMSPVSNYNCGSNERITSGTVYIAGVPLKQHAMIYRNCGSSSVKRKADVIADTDGKCMTIGAGKAIVIHQELALPTRTVYRSSKSC